MYGECNGFYWNQAQGTGSNNECWVVDHSVPWSYNPPIGSAGSEPTIRSTPGYWFDATARYLPSTEGIQDDDESGNWDCNRVLWTCGGGFPQVPLSVPMRRERPLDARFPQSGHSADGRRFMLAFPRIRTHGTLLKFTEASSDTSFVHHRFIRTLVFSFVRRFNVYELRIQIDPSL